MGTIGRNRAIDRRSRLFGKALAFAGLSIVTNAQAEGAEGPNPASAIKSSPSPASRLEWPAPQRPASVREFVFTSSRPGAELQGHYPSGWRVVCVGSCRTQAFVGATYRVSGSGVPSSKAFSVPDAPYVFSVNAQAGSTVEQIAGGAMIAVGSASLPAAFYLFLVGSCGGDCPGASQAERDRAKAATAAIGPVFFGGILTTAFGLLLYFEGATSVDVDTGEQAHPAHLRLGHGFELTPTGFVF